MSESYEITPSTPEVEPDPEMQVWIIDDDKERIETDLGYARDSLKGVQFNHFTTGHEAIDQLARLAETNQSLPSLIFLDHNLKPGDKFQYGTEVLPKLLEIIKTHSAKTKIIPFTSEQNQARKMEKAGADQAEIKQISAFIQRVKNELDIKAT